MLIILMNQLARGIAVTGGRIALATTQRNRTSIAWLPMELINQLVLQILVVPGAVHNVITLEI